jgi:DnaJ domain
VAELITWYDILGVTAGAASDTISYAYGQRIALLAPELFAGAPSPVLAAATRAREAVQAAWFVLGDPARRNRYDKEIGLYRERSHGFAQGPHRYGQDPFDGLRAADGLLDGDPGLAVTALAAWLAPQPAPPRRWLIVPDTRGLFFRSCQVVVAVAGLRLGSVQLTAEPSPVEGLVVGQSRAPGSRARRLSTLTVQVWHPPRRRPGV